MRRRNQKIGIVSYSSRKEEEILINKKRSSSNHKWEGRASAKKGAWRSFILPPQPASRLEKRNDKAKPELERSGQTRIGFTAWGLRESEKRNQAIGNSRESNVRESSETADSEYPSLVFTQIITRSQISYIGVCLLVLSRWGVPLWEFGRRNLENDPYWGATPLSQKKIHTKPQITNRFPNFVSESGV